MDGRSDTECLPVSMYIDFYERIILDLILTFITTLSYSRGTKEKTLKILRILGKLRMIEIRVTGMR